MGCCDACLAEDNVLDCDERVFRLRLGVERDEDVDAWVCCACVCSACVCSAWVCCAWVCPSLCLAIEIESGMEVGGISPDDSKLESANILDKVP